MLFDRFGETRHLVASPEYAAQLRARHDKLAAQTGPIATDAYAKAPETPQSIIPSQTTEASGRAEGPTLIPSTSAEVVSNQV